MSEERSDHHAMSDERLAEIAQWPPLESDVSDLLQEVKRLKQREKHLLALYVWARNGTLFDKGRVMIAVLGLPHKLPTAADLKRFMAIADAAMTEGEHIIEEASK